MNEGFDIGRSIEGGVSRIFEYLPQVFGAIVIFVVGYFIANILRAIVKRMLNGIRFDRSINTSPAGNIINRAINSPTKFVGKLVFWFVWLGFISLAVSALNLPALTNLVNAIYGFVPSIIAAMVIFLVASAVSAGSSKFVQRVMGNTPTSKLIAAVIPAITMSIAIFMILNELQIATDIVNITYTAIMGALGLGLALAFGLGGRTVASQILTQAYETSQRNKAEVKADLKRAKNNTKKEVRERI